MIFQRKLEVFKIIFEDLEKVSHIINYEKDWTKRALCRDEKGNQLFDPNDPSAKSWCILGALHKVEASTDTFIFLDFMAKQIGFNDVSRFNDHCTWEEYFNFFVFCLKKAQRPIIIKGNS